MVTRIGGLASGMDIDSIVENMLKVQRVPLDQVKQKKQILEWQRDDYRSMNTMLLNFKNNELFNMKLTPSYRAKTVSSSDDSKVSVSATSGANPSSYTIKNVTHLATAEVIKNGGSIVKESQSFSVNESLFSQRDKLKNSNIKWNEGVILTKSIITTATEDPTVIKTKLENLKDNSMADWSIKVDETSYKVVQSVTDVTDLKDDEVFINKSGDLTFGSNVKTGANIQITYIGNSEDGTDKYTTSSITTSTSTGEKYEQFLISSKDSLATFQSKINSSNIGVTLFYDSFSKQMTITRKETGNFNETEADIVLEGNLLNDGFQFGTSQGADRTDGQNAILNINGLRTERTSNSFTMDGVTFNLKQTFTDEVSLNVTNDNTKIVENIKSFIDKYNELISKINGKISETRNKDYQPLTDDNREGLSEKQQEKWEEIAKTGLLRRDSTLTNVLSSMRSDFYGTVYNNLVSSAYNQLSKIGITTTSNYLEGGKLEINEAKLLKAIEEDPTSVENLFRGENGIISKLQKTVTNAMDTIKLKAGSTLSTNQSFTIGRELENLTTKQSSLEDRLTMLETRYWKQFSAMETAINRANSQSTYLSQYFA